MYVRGLIESGLASPTLSLFLRDWTSCRQILVCNTLVIMQFIQLKGYRIVKAIILISKVMSLTTWHCLLGRPLRRISW